MQADRIFIGCNVKEKNSEYANLETEYLFKTLYEFGGNLGNAKRVACFTEEPDTLIKNILEKIQVQIRINEGFDNKYPFANAINILEEGIKEDVDVIIMLDTDIVISHDFTESLSKQKILAKPEDSDPFTLDDWQQLFDYFQLPFPQKRFQTSCTGQETIPYFNGGVVIIPKIHAVEFLDAWKYFIKKILTEQKNLPKNFTTSEKDPYGNIRFTGQIAFSLALVKTKLPYEALPLSMNYPYSGTVHPSQHPEKLEPFIIHHHHCIDEDGKLMYTPYQNINHQIDEINSFLKKNREYNIGLEKDDPLVIRNLTQEHKFSEVIDRLKDLPIDSTNADLQYYLALSLTLAPSITSKRNNEATVRYDVALENGFDKVTIYKDRAFLHFMSSDTDNAKKDLNSAFSINQKGKGEFLHKVVDAKDEVIRHHEGAIKDKDEVIRHHEGAIKDKDDFLHKVIDAKDEVITHHEGTIKDKDDFLHKVINAKDEVIGHHEQALDAKDDIIYHHKQALDAKDDIIGHHEQALKAKDDLITHYENIINSLDKSAQIKMLRKLGLLKKKPI